MPTKTLDLLVERILNQYGLSLILGVFATAFLAAKNTIDTTSAEPYLTVIMYIFYFFTIIGLLLFLLKERKFRLILKNLDNYEKKCFNEAIERGTRSVKSLPDRHVISTLIELNKMEVVCGPISNSLNPNIKRNVWTFKMYEKLFNYLKKNSHLLK